MGHTTVRIRLETHATLRALAEAEGRTMQAVLDEAVEALRRLRFLDGVNRAYAALRQDGAAWESVESERQDWEETLLDGLSVRETASPKRAHPKGRARR